MSTVAPAPRIVDAYSPAYRPTVVDFFCILVGITISLVLSRWSALLATATDKTPEWVASQVLPLLPTLLFLPVGILLFWPMFFLTQWVRGRSEWICSGEILWGLAWLALLPLVAWLVWQHWGTLPEALEPAGLKQPIFIGFTVGALALAALALLITLIGLIGRWRQPWTHSFGLALLLWPALPVAALFLWDIKLQ